MSSTTAPSASSNAPSGGHDISSGYPDISDAVVVFDNSSIRNDLDTAAHASATADATITTAVNVTNDDAGPADAVIDLAPDIIFIELSYDGLVIPCVHVLTRTFPLLVITCLPD
jgi:hypothetical protein